MIKLLLSLLAFSGLLLSQVTGTNPGVATAAAPVYGEGQRRPLSLDLAGNARIVIMGGSVVVTGVIADGATFTAGTSSIFVTGGVFNDGLAAVASGKAAAPRITNQRALHFNLRSSSGLELGVVSAPLVIGGDISSTTFTVPTRIMDAAGNLESTLFDVNTNAFADQWVRGVSVRKAAAGGSVEYGTSSNPFRVDPTGSTEQPVSGPLTDTQLRVTAVPVSGPLTDTQLRATAVPVSGPLTDTQLRASAVPVSAASLPLPSGASTAAKQPALGTAGTASADVISVQGIASMTPLLVNGSGVTQPISGTATVTQATGTNLHAVLDSGTTTVTQATGTNLHAVLDSGTTTVTQATGTNLHTVVDSGAVTATLATETTKVIGTVNQGTSPWTDQGALGDNGAAGTTNRLGTLPALGQSNLPSAATAGRNMALRTDLNGTLFSSNFPLNIATYAANKLGLVTVATPTDIFYLSGNATNTVIVTRVEMSCTQTTAGLIDVALIKRSTANSAGTCASMTAVPMDSGNAAASTVATSCTANPTLGAAVGNVDSKKIGVMAPATTGNDYYLWVPGIGQSVVLRNNQVLALNLNSVTLTGGNCNATFQWIETTPGP